MTEAVRGKTKPEADEPMTLSRELVRLQGQIDSLLVFSVEAVVGRRARRIPDSMRSLAAYLYASGYIEIVAGVYRKKPFPSPFGRT